MPRDAHSQVDHFTVKGYWWLPNSDHKVAGELHYDEDSITLTLFGGLSDAVVNSPLSTTPESGYPLVFGESEDNIEFTVLNAFYAKWTPNITTMGVLPGTKVSLRSSQLHCGRLLKGLHIHSADEAFATCRVEIPWLDVWLGVSPFSTDNDHDFNSVRLEYSRPATDEFEIHSPGCRIRFIHAVTPPALPFGTSPRIGHCSYLEIQPFEQLPIEPLIDRATEIVDLLSVAYGGPLHSRRVKLKHTPRDWNEVSLFYPRQSVQEKTYGSLDLLLRFEDLKPCFQSILTKWLNAEERLKRARRMLISSQRSPSTFIDLRFLPLAHAAEVLSHLAPQTTIIGSNEFKSLRTKMLSAVEDVVSVDLANSIKQALRWANGRSLRDKLQSLLGELSDETCELFSVHRDDFIAGVVSTRNHYTHYSTK